MEKEDLIFDGQLIRIISRLRYDDLETLVTIQDDELWADHIYTATFYSRIGE